MSCNKTYNKKGFGLLEVMIVVAIFTMTLAGVISVVGLAYKNLIKNELRWKAIMIGQNLVEQARNQRDNNILKGDPDPWDKGLTEDEAPKYYNANMEDCGLRGHSCPSGTSAIFRATYGGYQYPGSSSVVYTVTVEGAGPPIIYKAFIKDISKWR